MKGYKNRQTHEKGNWSVKFADEGISQKMREVGEDGFVNKSDSASELLKAIYTISQTARIRGAQEISLDQKLNFSKKV